MNENNSTLQRLIRKMNILDAIDEQQGSTKLNMIIQLPYTTRSESRSNQAKKEEMRSKINFLILNMELLMPMVLKRSCS